MSMRLIRCKRSAADQTTVAIKHHDLDGDVAAGDDALRRRLRCTRDFVAERNAFGPRQRKNFRGVVGGDDARAKLGGAAGGLRKTAPATRDRRRRAWSADR